MPEEWQWNASDGIPMFGWFSSAEPEIAGLVLVHGQGDHSGRYEHITKAMNQAGISVFGYDQRGHGRSGYQRGHILHYDQLITDLDQFINQAHHRIQEKPLFLYGQSMGGNVVLNYALRYPKKISAVAASSPWIKLAFEPSPIKVVLARAIDRIAPALSMKSGLEIKALSRNPEVCEKYQNDPLNHDRISARMYNDLYRAGLDLLDKASDFQIPIYVYHGTADRLTSHDASKEFAQRGNGKIVFRSWDGLFHETHNEPEGEIVIKTLVDWFLSKI